MGVEHLGAADEDAGFAAAGFAYPVGIPTYAMSASSRPPGATFLGVPPALVYSAAARGHPTDARHR
jgi:hypothetical protein